MPRADLRQDLDQAVGLLAVHAGDFGRAQETRLVEAQFAGQRDRGFDGEVGQRFIAAGVERFQQGQVSLEIRRFVVGNSQGLEMILRPGLRPVNFHILDGNPFGHTFAVDWDGQPLLALRGLDLVAVAPAMLIVLNVVVEDEQVGAADLVEVAAPGNVRGLEDDDVHFRFPTASAMT